MRARLQPLALAALALLPACGGGGSPGRNVLLVITDTVRADKLGCHGNPRGLTPNIDEFARAGLRFANASSHAPWTLPSIATMLTGLHPAEHGAGGRMGEFTALDGSVTTLPAVFGRAGYQTHCIANVAFLGEWTGVTRDFAGADVDAPASNLLMRDAARTTTAALEWLDRRDGRPFFLLVHYFDPHAVYDPPQPFRERFASPPDRGDESFKFPTRDEMVAIRQGNLPPAPIIRRAEALHDGEIAYMDTQVGRLFAGLAERGLADSTAVVLTADHGEEFLDHGGFEHGHQLYQELTHVPLIVRAPGLAPGTVEAVVGHVDLAATLCELADLAPDDQFVHFGRSLLAYGRGPDAEGRPILAHGNMWDEPLTSWRVGDEKLIQRADGTHEYYDLAGDAGERQDLARVRPARVAELAGRLAELQRFMRAVVRGESLDLSPAQEAALRATGYLGDEDD